jgi:hypothetical protein
MIHLRRRSVINVIVVATVVITMVLVGILVWLYGAPETGWVVSINGSRVAVCNDSDKDPYLLPIDEETVILDQRSSSISQLASIDALQPGQSVSFSAGSQCVGSFCLQLAYFTTYPPTYPEVGSITIRKNGQPADCPGWTPWGVP